MATATEPTHARPDDPRKADAPTDLKSGPGGTSLRKIWREFGDDQCTDLAAALTYYAVLSHLPRRLALISILGWSASRRRRVETVLDVLSPLVSEDTLGTIRAGCWSSPPPRAPGVGARRCGSLGALWSASGYVGAFGRAMNRIYEIGEGRPFWKLRPWMLLVTLVAIVLVALVLVMLIVSRAARRLDRRRDRPRVDQAVRSGTSPSGP